MPEILDEKDRKARKEHSCNYCQEIIKKGETYEWASLKADELYEWKNHKRCGFIARELWSFIDPSDGMTESDFQEGCAEFCHTFICKGCNDRDEDCYYCLDKIYDVLQKYELVLDHQKYGYWYWILEERKVQE